MAGEVRDARAVAQWRARNLAGGSVKIAGLAELQRELRALDKALPRELRSTNLSVAELVAERARNRARAQGGVAAKTAPSIKAAAEQRRASIKLGDARHPFALGAEFGSLAFKQFRPWRGNQWSFRGVDFAQHSTGYFLHPTIRDSQADVVQTYGDAIERLTARAFPT